MKEGSMKKAILWAVVLAVGFGLMAFSYWGLQKPAAHGATSAPVGAEGDDPPRVRPGPFYLYVLGQGLLLLGGAALLIRFFRFLGARTEGQVWHPALVAIRKYRRLFFAVHVIFFGTVIMMTAVVYHMPDVQRDLVTKVAEKVQSSEGPLAVAAKGYQEQDFALAAVVTLVVNLLIASFLLITVPSFIVPGVGVLVAGRHAVLWGLRYAPSYTGASGVMLPHSFALLLEGEAYVLATFFALLVPVYLLRPSEGPTVWRRYGRAVMLNLRGSLLVLIVLMVAALYEAAEVILMMKMGAK